MRLALLFLILLRCFEDGVNSNMTSSNYPSNHRKRRHSSSANFWSHNNEKNYATTGGFDSDPHESEPDYLPMDQTVVQDPPPPPQYPYPAVTEENPYESLKTQWINPEHPERRPGRYATEDDQTEFVRTDYSQTVYKKIRTYSSLPRQFECYSCMSLSYQTKWKWLQATYIYPKVFTDRCVDPNGERGMPTVMCSSVCVSMMEPDIEAGVFTGYKHIRGCLDRVLRHGFNQTALRTHRFHHHNQCRTLSRAQLFNPARITDLPAVGNVTLCSCYGDRCNAAADTTRLLVMFPLLMLFLFIMLRF